MNINNDKRSEEVSQKCLKEMVENRHYNRRSKTEQTRDGRISVRYIKHKPDDWVKGCMLLNMEGIMTANKT